MKLQNIVAIGKRKTARARAIIKAGSGIIIINKKEHKNLGQLSRLMIEEPLKIAENIFGSLKFDISVNVSGGGSGSQIEAARQAIARGLVKISKSEKLKKEYIKYDRSLLVSDVRKKEACKPGDSKARAKRQSSKR